MPAISARRNNAVPARIVYTYIVVVHEAAKSILPIRICTDCQICCKHCLKEGSCSAQPLLVGCQRVDTTRHAGDWQEGALLPSVHSSSPVVNSTPPALHTYLYPHVHMSMKLLKVYFPIEFAQIAKYLTLLEDRILQCSNFG